MRAKVFYIGMFAGLLAILSRTVDLPAVNGWWVAGNTFNVVDDRKADKNTANVTVGISRNVLASVSPSERNATIGYAALQGSVADPLIGNVTIGNALKD